MARDSPHHSGGGSGREDRRNSAWRDHATGHNTYFKQTFPHTMSKFWHSRIKNGKTLTKLKKCTRKTFALASGGGDRWRKNATHSAGCWWQTAHEAGHTWDVGGVDITFVDFATTKFSIWKPFLFMKLVFFRQKCINFKIWFTELNWHFVPMARSGCSGSGTA